MSRALTISISTQLVAFGIRPESRVFPIRKHLHDRRGLLHLNLADFALIIFAFVSLIGSSLRRHDRPTLSNLESNSLRTGDLFGFLWPRTRSIVGISPLRGRLVTDEEFALPCSESIAAKLTKYHPMTLRQARCRIR